MSKPSRTFISRRTVLRGAGRVAVCLPLLEAMACDPALRAQGKSGGVTPRAGGAPKRLIVFFVPNGTIPPEWFPDPSASETDFTLKSLMAPLAPYREQMLILSGVDNQVYLKGIVDNHNEGMTTLLTGMPAGDLLLPPEQRIIQQANGISLDQYVADAIGGGTVMPSLPIGYEWYHWLYDKNRNGIQHQGSPSQLFTALFGDPNADPAALDKLVARRKSILDDVATDYDNLLPKVSGADRLKLEEHLEAIRALEMGIGNTTSCKPEMPMYPAEYPQPQVDPAGLPLWVEHMTDLLALSLACDATRVSTFFIRHGGGGQSFFPWLGMDIIPEEPNLPTTEHHAMSHSWSAQPYPYDNLVKIHTWFSEQIAMLCGKLQAHDELGGSVLDNSVILVCSENAEGSHTKVNMPFLLIGSAGGHFRTGRHVQCGGAPHNRLLLSLAEAFGLPGPDGSPDHFGDPDFGGGPLSGLT
ncbi:MAG TPA: DUF1552 domain-containing protein [Nannocystis sp.]